MVLLHNPGKLVSYYVAKTGLELGIVLLPGLLSAGITGLCIHAWLFSELKESTDCTESVYTLLWTPELPSK